MENLACDEGGISDQLDEYVNSKTESLSSHLGNKLAVYFLPCVKKKSKYNKKLKIKIKFLRIQWEWHDGLGNSIDLFPSETDENYYLKNNNYLEALKIIQMKKMTCSK